MADTDVDAHLFVDWEPSLPCALPLHPEGKAGCNPDEAGTWIIRVMHGFRGQECTPVTIVVCESKVIRIRGMWFQTSHCHSCGEEGTTGDFIQIVGPVNPK